MKHRENPIPQAKLQRVKDLKDLIANKKTILIASIKNLPSAQLQEIGKSLRGQAVLKVPKKNLLFRALDESANEEVKKLKEKFDNSVAILFSDVDSFELSAELLKKKSPAKAKPGQEAPEDIEVQAGPTDLVPGPAISELGAVGLQVQIEKGKITIKDSKVIVKAGDKISQEAADVMSKLDIKPFSVGLTPVAAFDTKENKLYLDINIDSEKTVAELKNAFGRALPFAVEIGYVNSDTITFMIGKASAHEKALSGLVKTEEKEELKEEAPAEEAPKKEAEEKPAASEEEKQTEEKPAEEKKEESQEQTQAPETKTEENKPQEEKK